MNFPFRLSLICIKCNCDVLTVLPIQIDEKYRIFKRGQTVVDLVSSTSIPDILARTYNFRDMRLVHGLK